MNVTTFGSPERSWASAGYAAQYARGVANYKRSLWRMSFLEGQGAGTFGPFLFPRPVHVIRLHAFVLSAVPADAAGWEFGISDVSDRPRDQAGAGQIVTDGRFNRTAPLLALSGSQFGWFLVDRWQPMNSQWIWTIVNTGGGSSPVFMLEVETAAERQHEAVFR